MATTEPLTGVTVPQQTDAALGGLQIGTLATQIAPFATPRFTTTAARDAAYTAYVTAGGTLSNGMSCWTADSGYWDRIGGAWVARVTVGYVDGTNGVLSLVGGWAAYGGYHVPRWYLSSSGWVTLSGRVLRTAATFALGSGGTNFQFATLDSSCVPATAVEPGGGWAALNTTLNTYPVLVRCAAADTALCVVGMDSGTGDIVTGQSFVNLDGVRFHI